MSKRSQHQEIHMLEEFVCEAISIPPGSPRAKPDRQSRNGKLPIDSVWVFKSGSDFPSAVFTTRELAEKWIAVNKLSGMLTKYPLNVEVYEWAITNGAFKPARPDQSESDFIGRFSSANLEHHHYEGGVAKTNDE